MFKQKSFVKWEDEIISERIMRKNLDPLMILSMPKEKFITRKNYNLIRDIVTMLDYASYHFNYLNDKQKHWYESRNLIERKLNKIFDYLMSNSLRVYDAFDEMFNKEKKYAGERRFNLLNRTNRKGWREISVLKQTCWYLYYINNLSNHDQILFNDPTELKRIFTSPLSGSFRNEELEISDELYDESPEIFKEFNRKRKKIIETQDKFVDLMVFENNFNAAYKMIKDEIKEERKDKYFNENNGNSE
ncbi:MAG: hypothetical protein [Caudoviricetes sp.]|nr:MAG: hypothetical protein [Caudoviricetes sp.]